jgi:eukaryotic-like serine/threonine-protein kinase
MRLSPGSKLGAYEVVAPLGAGGMGEVYRARDVALDREVAVKVVNPRFFSDPDSRARLHREARALAALNHPHVAAVHELGESDSGCYIVMEYVPGETLDSILARGPLSINEALRQSLQIAAALEAAHEKGLVHRDLKPANVRVTPDGIVKVLDFGLARHEEPDSTTGGARGVTTFATDAGVTVGTAMYMSPEQARGRHVDKRADVWAFGCVLFELLTGQRAFDGPSTPDILVAILEREPNWSLLPRQTPPTIRRLVRRCLEKDVARRLRDIGDARLEIEEALTPAGAEAAVPAARASERIRMAATLSAIVVAAMVGAALALWIEQPPAAAMLPPGRFVVPLDGTDRFSALDFPAVALSPDGTVVVYAAARGERTQLFVRRFDGRDATAIAASADAVSPFFSPDSQWIAFFAEGKLKKVPATGGTPVVICDAATGFGGSWGADDTIVFAPAPGSPLMRVSAGGGQPERLTRLDAGRGEFSHRWPELLPHGNGVLYTVGTVGSWDDAELVVQSLAGDRRQVLVKGGTNPHYVDSGHLLYAHLGAAWVVPFDAERLAVTGTPVRVLEDVFASSDGAAQLSISRTNTLVYVPASSTQPQRRLIALGPGTDRTPLAAPARAYFGPRVSPDGRQIALTISAALEEVWIYDLNAATLRQLTFESVNAAPIWTADGRRVTFSSNRSGALNLFVAAADGTGVAERLTASDNIQLPGSWSADGRVLAFVEHHPTTGRDIWTLDYQDGRRTAPLLNSTFDETAPAISPDGRWLAHVSNETGRAEVYVRSIVNPAVVVWVSQDEGSEPVWGRDGRELFYRSGNRLMSVPVTGASTPRIGAPRIAFDGPFETGTADRANFDVVPGAGRFIAVTGVDQPTAPTQFHIVLNWTASSQATR